MNFIIMPRFGTNLQTYCKLNGYPKESSVITIGLSILDHLECIHDAGFTYNDLKPANILLDYNSTSLQNMNLIDFGLASKYLDSNGNHKPVEKLPTFDGNIMFASAS